MFKATGVLKNDNAAKRRTVIFKGDSLSGDATLIKELTWLDGKVETYPGGYTPKKEIHLEDGLAVLLMLEMLCDDVWVTGDAPKLTARDGVDY